MKSRRASFQEGGTYRARKDFRFHGRTFGRGAKFPWRQLSCSARKLFQLYDNGFLELDGSEPDDKEKRREAGRKAAETRKRKAEVTTASESAKE